MFQCILYRFNFSTVGCFLNCFNSSNNIIKWHFTLAELDFYINYVVDFESLTPIFE